jgi:hypothetical protein
VRRPGSAPCAWDFVAALLASPGFAVLVNPTPDPVGDPLIDAWIGATGEHLAQRSGLRVPERTQRSAHFALQESVFLPASLALRGVVIEGYRGSARETASAASAAVMNSLSGRFGNGVNPKSR